jgi:ribosomal protein S20
MATNKIQANRLGFISKSKTGKSLLTVEQDMTLQAGDKLLIESPQSEIDNLVAKGFIDEETAEERKNKLPKWKLSNVKLLPRSE